MRSDKQPLVSIVTPVYNEAAYLAECIESILAQTYTNWEYILIDNCSTDSSGAIASSYAQRDSRIRVVRTPKLLTATANHNFALQQCSPASKYCKVVQGDDWIFPECVERMVASAEQHPRAGIVGAYGLAGTEVVWTGLEYSTSVLSGREACRRHLLEKLYIFGSPTSVLYRADLVRNQDAFYNEANVHNDTEACFLLLKECDFGFVHQVLTFTRVRPQSRTTISNSLYTGLGGMLLLLVEYGPFYLTADELQARLNRELNEYYQFLGKSVLLRRPRVFWEYHRKQFALVGLRFKKLRVAGGVVAECCSAALDPRGTITKLLRRKSEEGLSGSFDELGTTAAE